MPVVFDCFWDFVSVACSSSWNSNYDFAAVHSLVVEVVHHIRVVVENRNELRDLVEAVNHRDFRNCLVMVVDYRDFRSCLVAVPVPRNRSLPA